MADIIMLLMAEKDITAEVCLAIYWYAKPYNKYMEYYNKKESS